MSAAYEKGRIAMGRCFNCQARFLGDKRYCPKCRTDLWYEGFNNGGLDFKELQEEGHALLEKGSYEKASVALEAAMSQVMYGRVPYSMNRLNEAVTDIVWLYSSEACDVSDEYVTDVLDFYEQACYGKDTRYRDSLYSLRKTAAIRIPETSFADRQEPDYPETRSYWKLPSVREVIEDCSDENDEPDILQVQHLTLTEAFFSLYIRCAGVLKLLQTQEALTIEFIYEQILPLIHPDLDMSKNGTNSGAVYFGELFCWLLEDGFDKLARLYLSGSREDYVMYLKERCSYIEQECEYEPHGLLYMAAMAPLLASRADGEAVYQAAEPEIRSVLERIRQINEKLRDEIGKEEHEALKNELNRLCAEYACMYGAGQYRIAKMLEENEESYLDAMETAAGNGITMAAEEMMRCYFYGYRGCELNPGYAKFYSRLVSLRHVASSMSDVIESVKDVEMAIPGDE